jgi:hypothetical protein
MTIMAVHRFERFFRAAAGLDVDKDDLKRYSEFVSDKLHDLLMIGQATAKANGRDILQPRDLPITKGLQDSIHVFREVDEEIESRLPEVVGGLSVALARTIKVIDPEVKNPQSAHWADAFSIFGLLL